MYEDYMTTEELAKFIGVKRHTVEKWRNKGWLMPDVIGHGKNGHSNVYYYSKEHVLQLAAVYRKTDERLQPDCNSSDLLNNDCNRTATTTTQTEYEENLTQTVRTLAINAPMNDTPKQILENLPQEILDQPRFFPVGANKVPQDKGWSNPDNQKHYTEIKGYVGFDTAGHDRAVDYLFLDFDHIFTDAGQFVNVLAEDWFNMVVDALKTYCELSASLKGAHVIAVPTAGKFPKVASGKNGRIYFDDEKKSFVEIFYGTGGRYCFFTGNVYRCEPNAPVAHGQPVDDVFKTLLNEVALQNQKPKKSTQQKQTARPVYQSTNSPDFDIYRAEKMLEVIRVAELSREDWLNVGMALKNNGNTCADWEQWSRADERFKDGECDRLWQGFNGAGLTIATIHDLAKQYGYSEKDTQREWYQLHPDFDKFNTDRLQSARKSNHKTDAEPIGVSDSTNESAPRQERADSMKVPNDHQTTTKSPPNEIPTPDKAEKTDYLTTSNVAKIIGVTKQTVEYWRKKGWFNADMIDHTAGVYYYTVERVMQLKDVYRPDWEKAWRGDPASTTDTDFLQQEQPAQITNTTENFNGEIYMTGLLEDLDNGRRLAKFCSDRVKWLTDSERWIIWDNKGVWLRCSEKNSCLAPEVSRFADLMMRHAIQLIKEAEKFSQAYLEISTEKDGRVKTNATPEVKDAEKKMKKANEKKEKALAIARDFRKVKKVSCAITMMKGVEDILITAEDLDNHPNLINCLNYVVDLQDKKLYPHIDTRLKLITQQCRAAYIPDAKSELVDSFFKAIQPDEMTCAGLLRWLGYCLTGEVSEEKFMVHTGDGGNGKGVLSATVLELLASYGVGLAPTALLKSNKPIDADKASTALNGIELARFAISEEMPADGELDTSLIKNLTGGDRINLRKLYSEYRTVKPTAKINISGNYTPKIENVHDGGLLRRMLNMPYLVKFGTPNNPADHNLKKKMFLPENLNALLRLLVDEAFDWYRDGLIISPQMAQETKRHLAQNDFIADFIDDNETYERGANFTVKAKEFIDALKREYPRECSRFKRNDLIKLIAETDGITYTTDRTRARVFRGIGKKGDQQQQSFDDFDGEPISPDDLQP